MRRLICLAGLAVLLSPMNASELTGLLQELRHEKEIVLQSLNAIESERQQISRMQNERETQLNERQFDLEQREQQFSERETELQAREIRLNEREKRLLDKKAALEKRELQLLESESSLTKLKKSLETEREAADRSVLPAILVSGGVCLLVGAGGGFLLSRLLPPK